MVRRLKKKQYYLCYLCDLTSLPASFLFLLPVFFRCSALTLKESTTQGQGCTRARETHSQTNQGIARQQVSVRQFISFLFPSDFFLLFSFTHYPCKLMLPSPRLSYVVSVYQRSFAPPRELQASVTLSYMRRVKTRRRANGHRSVQNLGQMSASSISPSW